MLYLIRRPGQNIDLINRNNGRVIATIQVAEILPNNDVRLAISADESIQILRDDAKNRRPNGY